MNSGCISKSVSRKLALLVIVFVHVDRFLAAGHRFNPHVVIAPILQDDEAAVAAMQDEIEGNKVP